MAMAFSREVIAGVAAYAFGLLILAAGVLPPLATAALAAPYALLIPSGLGLLLAFGWQRSIPDGVGRVQALLVAWLLGALFIIFAYVVLERYGLTGSGADALLFVICVLAAIGVLLLGREIWPGAGDRGVLRVVLLVGTPLVLIRYAASVVIYSDFPVLDLFQRTHFHVGALAFAKHDVLNPFVADSYIPFQQLLLGLMARGAGVDPLRAEWVPPAAMAPLQIGAVFAVVARLTRTPSQLGLALGLGLALLGLSNPTNGDVAEMAALLVLSLLVANVRAVESWRTIGITLLVTVTTVGIGIVVLRAPVLWSLFALVGLSVLASLTFGAARIALLTLAVFSALAFHRSAALFVVMAVLAGVALEVFERARRTPRLASMIYWLSFGVVLLVAGMTAHILLLGGHLPQDEFGLWSAFDYLLNPMTGKRMSDVVVDFDLAQGAGGRIALFEVGRKLSILGIVICGLFVLRLVWKAAFAERGGAGTAATENEGEGIPVLLVSLLLLAFTLTGFPFVHRGAFLIVVLLSIVIALFVFPYRSCSELTSAFSRSVTWILVAYLVALMAFVMIGVEYSARPFLERLYPLLFAMVGIGVLFAVLPSRFAPTARLGGLLVIAIMVEATVSRAYFKSYAYFGQMPAGSGAFSHYGHRELDTADRIAAVLAADAVVVSDPKTMALVGARSGNPPLISFSNLNTMVNDSRLRLSTLLEDTVRGASGNDVCRELLQIIDSSASGQFNYARARRLVESGAGLDALQAINYNNALVPRAVLPGVMPFVTGQPGASFGTGYVQRVAVVVSPDTLDWVSRPADPSYFPVSSGSNLGGADLLTRLGGRGQIVGDAVLLSLECK
ncbi:hypothetical protein [Azospira restricta]|uniref:Uncharacterized protein n=1 Tax=Azospira restricta TaxID=404405 RepID=A0A974Y3X5_9RHOO|nr:hypothetical protein [Azospira restricta]QRJ64056.1 hypothetical protein IWH25_01470 [Azospira restricta]